MNSVTIIFLMFVLPSRQLRGLRGCVFDFAFFVNFSLMLCASVLKVNPVASRSVLKPVSDELFADVDVNLPKAVLMRAGQGISVVRAPLFASGSIGEADWRFRQSANCSRRLVRHPEHAGAEDRRVHEFERHLFGISSKIRMPEPTTTGQILRLSIMCCDLKFLAVGFWRKAEMTFEDAGQVTLIGEAALKRDISKRCIRLSEQILRFLDALP